MSVLNLDIAQRLDIICRKGDTFEFSFDVGIDVAALGDWQMEIRASVDDDTASSSEEIIESTSNSVESGSVVALTIPASRMKDVPAGLYVYDVQLASVGGAVKTFLYGVFRVNDDITV